MVAVPGTLNKQQVIAYIGQHAPAAGVDPAAMLAVANHEGLGTDPGSFWTVPGELFNSFGPPSWNANPRAAGGPIVAQQGGVSSAAHWAWTPAGLDYWINAVAGAARGLRGTAAISAIVNGFEHPREDLAAGEIQNASRDYQSFVNQIAGGTGIPLPITGPTDIGISPPTTTEPSIQTPAQTTVTAGAGGNPTGFNLGLADSVAHIGFQFLIVLIAIALLLGGIYLLGSHK